MKTMIGRAYLMAFGENVEMPGAVVWYLHRKRVAFPPAGCNPADLRNRGVGCREVRILGDPPPRAVQEDAAE